MKRITLVLLSTLIPFATNAMEAPEKPAQKSELKGRLPHEPLHTFITRTSSIEALDLVKKGKPSFYATVFDKNPGYKVLADIQKILELTQEEATTSKEENTKEYAQFKNTSKEYFQKCDSLFMSLVYNIEYRIALNTAELESEQSDFAQAWNVHHKAVKQLLIEELRQNGIVVPSTSANLYEISKANPRLSQDQVILFGAYALAITFKNQLIKNKFEVKKKLGNIPLCSVDVFMLFSNWLNTINN